MLCFLCDVYELKAYGAVHICLPIHSIQLENARRTLMKSDIRDPYKKLF
jgi:hypothetical protein